MIDAAFTRLVKGQVGELLEPWLSLPADLFDAPIGVVHQTLAVQGALSITWASPAWFGYGIDQVVRSCILEQML